MMEEMGGWVVCGWMVAIVAFVIWLDNRQRQSELIREKALSDIADKLEFAFSKGPHQFEDLHFCILFSHGRLSSVGYTPRSHNLLAGMKDGVLVRLFEYVFGIVDEDSLILRKQTVLAFTSDKLHMPQFILHPKSSPFPIVSNIDVGFHPALSSRYILQGRDKQSVQAFFTDALQKHLEMKDNICIEGERNTLICYRPFQVVPVNDIFNFLEEGWKLFNRFTLEEQNEHSTI